MQLKDNLAGYTEIFLQDLPQHSGSFRLKRTPMPPHSRPGKFNREEITGADKAEAILLPDSCTVTSDYI